MDGCSQRWVLTTQTGVSPVSGDTPLFVVRKRPKFHPSAREALGGLDRTLIRRLPRPGR